MHVELDLLIKTEAPILFALNGKVFAFNFNANFGDRAPKIIVAQHIKNQIFHSLDEPLTIDSR